jgi:hypothetical protein
VITVDDLFRDGRHASLPWPAEPVQADPLRDVDALREVQLLDSRVSHLTSTAALLLEMRTALQFDRGNCALLVVRGVRSFEWDLPRSVAPVAALTIMGSRPGRGDTTLQLQLAFYPEARLALSGDRGEFYVLDSKEIGDVPPDYSDAELRNIQHHLPTWTSECTPIQFSTSS